MLGALLLDPTVNVSHYLFLGAFTLGYSSLKECLGVVEQKSPW